MYLYWQRAQYIYISYKCNTIAFSSNNEMIMNEDGVAGRQPIPVFYYEIDCNNENISVSTVSVHV